jgi:hypothetical protein
VFDRILMMLRNQLTHPNRLHRQRIMKLNKAQEDLPDLLKNRPLRLIV